MLWTIVVVLFLLWLVGFIGFPAVGGSLIHILLVIAVIVLIYNLVTGRKAVWERLLSKCFKEWNIMNTKKIKLTLIISFVVVILLFLLFSSMVITGALANGGMMGDERMTGISWMWIPTLLSLGLVFLIGWAIFSTNVEKVLKA